MLEPLGPEHNEDIRAPPGFADGRWPRAMFLAEPTDMGLLAADLVHNPRAAVDHVVARLKEALGARGHFRRPRGSPTAVPRDPAPSARTASV